ncbi:MAG: flagellar hook assembly protein FlgD [Rhodobacteraceae bacterium]|jgi:flagellar basal-body rod modification protein FlgD|nr:flagellar hook assembly protein FlgD [Paracoccaceae bacterium]
MDVTNTPSLIGNAGGNSASSLSQLSEDYNRFLTLLTAQVQHQDPLAPMDSTQFVSQLAQLSQVEQAVSTNAQLEKLGSQIVGLTAVSGLNMVGRDVTISTNRINQVDGGNESFYRIVGDADEVVAEIRDPLDRLVRTIENMPVEAGKDHAIAWDGRDNDGQPVLDGMYTLTLRATDGDGEAVPAFSYRRGDIQEVLFEGGELYYKISGDEIVASDTVLAVR